MTVCFPSKRAEDNPTALKNTSGRGIHLATALASGALISLYFMRLHPRWHTNDDLGILLFLTGELDGNPTWQLPFVSPLASLPLRFVTAIFGIAGYSLLLLILVWASCWILSVNLIGQMTRVRAVHLLNLVLALGTVQIALLVVVLNFTFTVVAGITVTAIIASMALEAYNDFTVGIFRKVFNAAILTAGLSLRPEIGTLVILLMIPVLVSLSKTSALKLISVIAVSTWLINKLLGFGYSEEFKSWLKYNSVRGSLHGNSSIPLPSEDLLNKLSWSDNDYQMFQGFLHFDQSRFSLETLQSFATESQIGWIAEVRQITLTDFHSSLTTLGPIVILVLALVLLKALDVRCRGGYRAFFLAGIISLMITSILAVAVLSRVRIPARVEIPIAFATLIGSMVLLLCDRHGTGTDRRSTPNKLLAYFCRGKLKFATYSVLLLVVITSGVHIHGDYVEVGTLSRTRRLELMARQEEVYSLLDSRASREVTLILEMPIVYRSPFSNSDIFPPNTVSFGWPIGSPPWKRGLENLGIDLREALIRGPEDLDMPYKLSFLSGSYPEILSNYILEEAGSQRNFIATSCVGTGRETTCLMSLYDPPHS